MNNTISSDIEKGCVILNEAIKQYKNGNNKKAYSLYESAGKMLSRANEKSKTDDGKDILKYGDNLNFGMAYNIFESNTADMLKTSKGRNNMSRIVRFIRENKVLKNEFDIYNALTNPCNVDNPENYVNEVISLVKHYSPDELREENRKFISLLKECKIDCTGNASTDDIELFESVEYIIINKKDLKNVNEYNKIRGILCEYVSDNNRNVLKESVSIDDIYETKINEMVEKHVSELNEDELKLIEDASDPIKAKKMFNENKNEVSILINEQISTGKDIEEWTGILEKVNAKTYDKETALTDIAEFIEIKNEILK